MNHTPVRPPIYDVGEGNGEESVVGTGTGEAALSGHAGHQEPREEVEGEDGDGGAVRVDEESYGERKPKAAKQPEVPTKAERDSHYPLHINYRSWCYDCVRGRSIGKQHRRREAYDESMGIVVSIDYCFKLPEELEDDLSPILIAYDHRTRAIWTLEVDAKGIEAGVGTSWLVAKLDMAGYAGMRITIRSDQEPSILNLKKAVAIKRNAETALLESPVQESKSNGKVERAVRTWRDQFRTLRSQFERRTGSKLERNGALSTWLVSFAAEVMNKFKVQENGKTAFETMTSHKCTQAVVGFGEVVYFQHTANKKDEYRKDIGIFVGVNDRCNTFLVATEDGVFGSPHIMRLPEDQSYDGQRASQIRTGYYDYLKDGVLPPPALIPVRGEAVASGPDTEAAVTVGGPYVPRRARITKADLIKYGFTPGFPACLSAQFEDGIRRGGHSEECRKRIETSMPGEKIDRAQARIDQWTSAQIEQGENRVETEGQPASGSGLTEKERESTPTILDDGKVVRSEVSESRRDEPIPEPALLEQAPSDPSERRFRTPDRVPAVKRRPMEDGDAEHLRRRIATPGSEDMDDGLVDDRDSPLAQWYNGTQPSGDPDQTMSFLDETDRKILASVILNVDITEVYSPVRVNRVAAKFGLCAGSSMDLTTGWDFSKESDIRKAWKVVKETRPFIIIGSPPCTLFSNLQELNKHVHRHDESWMRAFEERRREAVMHLQFCALLYNYQLRHGYHFLHEHPWSAKSWMIPEIQELLNKPNVELVETHMCRFGMESHWDDKNGMKGPVKKPTGFMTSAPRLAEKLAKKCRGEHEHVHLMGGRATHAQVYPDPLCHAIAEGVLEQKRDDNKAVVEMPKMGMCELKKFVGFLGIGIGETVREKEGVGYPIGYWPSNWIDPIHEEAGGSD